MNIPIASTNAAGPQKMIEMPIDRTAVAPRPIAATMPMIQPELFHSFWRAIAREGANPAPLQALPAS